jgi:hypothetical protein
MKKFLFASICFLIMSQGNAFCQADAPGSKESISKLKSFLTSHITEKAYLQFDKSYYAAGDTIYFKAYVTLGEKHQLSGLSGILHVDLINTKNKVDQSIKLQITEGVTWGDFALPDSLPAGNYRVLAYTRWMRNDGNYFEQAIPIGSLHSRVSESGSPAKPLNPNSRPAVLSRRRTAGCRHNIKSGFQIGWCKWIGVRHQRCYHG